MSELALSHVGPEAAADSGVPLVEVAGVKRSFRTPAGRVQAVAGVDLALRPGEAVALVGESGSGKTTLARMIVGLDAPSEGTIRFHGQDLRADRRRVLRELHEKVSIVFQDPYSSLDPKLPIWRSVEEPLAVHGRGSRSERRRKADELLDSVGLDPIYADRRPQALSGGQRQRAAIARAIALDPELVVLDEPVSALDVSVQAQVLNLLRDLRESLDLTYLFVSHDLAVVRHVTNRVAVMYLGRLVEEGPIEHVFARPSHPYTIALLSSAMDLGDGGATRIVLGGDPPSPIDPPRGCRFHPRCFRARERCVGEEPRLGEFDGRACACHYPGPLGPGDEPET
jgi:oligopeptide/dipeptide ABC transporter ATP-binding protein